jgi:hypothetical protein
MMPEWAWPETAALRRPPTPGSAIEAERIAPAAFRLNPGRAPPHLGGCLRQIPRHGALASFRSKDLLARSP